MIRFLGSGESVREVLHARNIPCEFGGEISVDDDLWIRNSAQVWKLACTE
eukprot:m.654793 g.654793  ORF g.654793 m.654793 type:complete len:50 (-) comp22691_c2_seq88:1366-1515(-)